MLIHYMQKVLLFFSIHPNKNITSVCLQDDGIFHLKSNVSFKNQGFTAFIACTLFFNELPTLLCYRPNKRVAEDGPIF